jgi:hypothetical protein
LAATDGYSSRKLLTFALKSAIYNMGDSSAMEIEKKLELERLQAQTQALAMEIHRLYGEYLTALARALRHHTIQACYQICTNCYPQEFLGLAPLQQQGLQKSLRRAISNSVIDLLQQLQPVTEIREPDALMDWIQSLDEAIDQTLPSLSKKLNYLLQQSRIVPQQVPRQVLEAAVKVEETGESSSKRPNILSVLVEKDSPGHAEEMMVIPVHVIFLRLPEIEFADLELSKLRQQIQANRAKVAGLRRSYRHKQRQVQSLAAVAAWHQSWFGSAEEE